MAKRRKPGSGSVHLRKDGRWEGRCVVGYDQRGYPRTRNCLAKTKGECLRKLKALREQCRPPDRDCPTALSGAAPSPAGRRWPRRWRRGRSP